MTNEDPIPTFPQAAQPQIIRAHQKDELLMSTFREQTEGVLRSWLGTRWITRWTSEVNLAVQLCYGILTSVYHTQSLGEEYVDIWKYHGGSSQLPTKQLRLALIMVSHIPSYVLSKARQNLSRRDTLSKLLHSLPHLAAIAAEVNLAIFYLTGRYYNIHKRVLRVNHISSFPEDPNNPPPTYSLLGVLLSLRLLHRLYTFLKTLTPEPQDDKQKAMLCEDASGRRSYGTTDGKPEPHIDSEPVSAMIARSKATETEEGSEDRDNDPDSYLDLVELDQSQRSSRRCALCLEQRRSTTVTECGHLFCWTCVVSWSREKGECPLCRQSLSLSKLVPLYNM
ncbi:peroxisome biogenesis factor 10 [Tulasnella sp. 419]|nr:peroxisome biogenesis factor 10 [Tulasnella sp. 418]KAG8938359.1 peroxisome biogenesis factor 10 [Tulasnella sp. 419]